MALNTYTDLQTAILAHLGRPGDTNIPVTDMIVLAEAEFNRLLQTQNQIAFTDITTVANQQDYALSALVNAILEVKITSTDPTRVLESMGPGEFDVSFPFAETGQPTNYTIIGGTISFGPTPDGVYVVRLRYYSKIPPLSDSNTTNWLLSNHPDAYLFQSLRHAQTFLGSDDTEPRSALFEQRAQLAIRTITQQDIRFKTGGTPTRMRTYLRPRDSTFPR